MQQIKTTIAILFISMTINAQQDIYGINFNLGISKITNPLLKSINESAENNVGLSGNVGVYYNHFFNTKSLIEINLLYSVLSSNETENITIYDDSSSTTENRNIKFQKRNYYITVPIKYGLKYNDFIYSLGLQTAFNIANFIETEGGWYKESQPKMYISKGIGTSILPIRFGARTEMVEIEI